VLRSFATSQYSSFMTVNAETVIDKPAPISPREIIENEQLNRELEQKADKVIENLNKSHSSEKNEQIDNSIECLENKLEAVEPQNYNKMHNLPNVKSSPVFEEVNNVLQPDNEVTHDHEENLISKKKDSVYINEKTGDTDQVLRDTLHSRRKVN
jgi:thiamine pyrophosphate-dependent acetolactate synthase large subunit-like protein